MKIGAVIVVVMGLSMLSQGFALGGWNLRGGISQEKIQAPAVAAEIVDDAGKIISAEETRSEKRAQVEPAASGGIEIVDGKQIVKSTLNPYRYPAITVKKDVPVHWEIEAGEDALTGCNYRMVFRDFGFAYEMSYGKNVIEFTPEKAGTFQYTCWMGMVRGVVKVVD